MPNQAPDEIDRGAPARGEVDRDRIDRAVQPDARDVGIEAAFPEDLRDGYMEALEEYLVEVRRGCARKGIDYMLVPTNEYIDAVLSKFLHYREAMLKNKSR